MGNVVRNKTTIHGKKIELTRGGKKVNGVILSPDAKRNPDEFLFQWKDAKGVQISPISADEMEVIKATIV